MLRLQAPAKTRPPARVPVMQSEDRPANHSGRPGIGAIQPMRAFPVDPEAISVFPEPRTGLPYLQLVAGQVAASVLQGHAVGVHLHESALASSLAGAGL